MTYPTESVVAGFVTERARVREASRKPGGQWPPQTGVRPIRQENKLLIPAAFSPVR
jgi:hypothetical protein